MRGHGATVELRDKVTREGNLADVVAAYDRFIAYPLVDRLQSVVGSSYGGYLAAALMGVRENPLADDARSCALSG